jgi:hypothetical protein
MQQLSDSFSRRSFTGKRLFNTGGAFNVWRLKALKQTIRACLQELRQAGKGGDGKWEISVFERTDCLNVHICQLRQTLLRKTCFEASRSNVPSDHPKNLRVIHRPKVNLQSYPVDIG